MSKDKDASVINDAIADAVPEMPELGSTKAQLLCGVSRTNDKGVERLDIIEVRELTGEDEEYLASVSQNKNLLYTDYTTEILKRGIVKIGDVEVAKRPDVIDSLIFADRDIAFLAILRCTYGDTRELYFSCSSCGQNNTLTLELDKDFPVKEPDFDVKMGLSVETSKGTIRLRLPNGKDSSNAQSSADTDAEINTQLLASCAIFDEDEPEDRVKWARSLKLPDRRKLVNALLEVEVGPKLGEVDTHCAECGSANPLMLDWVSLLLS